MPHRKQEVVTRAKPLVATAFRQRSDFTYQRLVGLQLRGTDVRRSLFIGALVESCLFDDVDFARSDFSGTKLVRSHFRRCRFRLAELRSCEFADCTFEECDFSLSHWSGTRSHDTRFHGSRFAQSTVTESRFERCEIVDALFKGASVTSDTFQGCRFERTGFADCTAMFLFLDRCAFDKFAMNAESVGFTFGLTGRDLEKIDLIYLGKRQTKPANQNLVEVLATSYADRHWFVGSAAIDINFERRPVVIILKTLSEQLKWLHDQGLPFDRAELQFLLGILECLQRSGRLPLLGTWYVGKAFQPTSERSQATTDSVLSILTRFNRLFSIGLDQVLVLCLPEKPVHYALKIVLDARPGRPLDQLVAPVLDKGELEFVRGYEGSWTEIWEAAHNAVFTIDLLLVMAMGLFASFAETARGYQRMVAAIREPANKKRRKGVSEPTDAVVTLAAPVAMVAQDARLRSLRFSPEAVRRVDAALSVLAAMTDEELSAFLDYGPPKVQSVTIKPIEKQQKRRSPARRRSA